jgi:hypothetical protein
MRLHFISMAGVILLAITSSLLGGCAASQSAESISKSVSSPFKLSSSLVGGDDSAMYRQDVERTTIANLRAGGDANALRHSLAGLAHERGISDWAADAATLEGIVAGLRSAGLDAEAQGNFADRLLGQNDEVLLQLAEHPAR